jgi:hypothetical protein
LSLRNRNPALLSIIAHARSGALEHAWRLYREAGLEAANEDPAVLSVRGRLLKDLAVASHGDERRRLYLEAADAYAAAGAASDSTYPLINAATLSLLAGASQRAHERAALVLAQVDVGVGEPDTAYYQEATRAEALLVLGRIEDAKASLAVAFRRAPRAWEDHASTLRQFRLILDALEADASWLKSLQPPRSLHFGGHMAISQDAEALSAGVAALLEAENIGFGFGALAAGADILIAEALLNRGAELHVVLPARPDAFRDASVAPAGGDWGARYERLLSRADTVRAIAHADTAPRALAVRIGAEAAMGAAVMQGRALTSEALQLLILDGEGAGGESAWMRQAWRTNGRRSHTLEAPRDGSAASVPHALPEAGSEIAAVLAVEARGAAPEALTRLGHAVASGPATSVAPRWSGQAALLSYATPSAAATAALGIIDALDDVEDLRIGGHYAIARRTPDPFGGQDILLGPATTVPCDIQFAAPPRTIQVSEDFAAALNAGPEADCPHTEYVGDLPPSENEDEIRLFSLRR